MGARVEFGYWVNTTPNSDAHIVRGLIAIVLATFDGHSPDDIVAYDIENLFDELDLMNHLSATRGNGLRALVKRINDTADRYVPL